MTRPTRLHIATALILAIGCSTAQRAAESVPLEDRLRAEVVALHTLCIELPDNAAPDLKQLCAMFMRDDASSSGDGGPAPIIEERGKTVDGGTLNPDVERRPGQMENASPKERDTAAHAPNALGAPTKPSDGQGVRKVE